MGDNLTDTIKHFKSLQKRYTTQNNERQCDFVKTAIEALEKQEIKSCYYCQDGVYYDVLGSICKYSFCPMCGNNLDETEEE